MWKYNGQEKAWIAGVLIVSSMQFFNMLRIVVKIEVGFKI